MVIAIFWCERRDLNPYGITTRPSNVRVCRFRHARKLCCRFSCDGEYYSKGCLLCQAVFKKSYHFFWQLRVRQIKPHKYSTEKTKYHFKPVLFVKFDCSHVAFSDAQHNALYIIAYKLFFKGGHKSGSDLLPLIFRQYVYVQMSGVFDWKCGRGDSLKKWCNTRCKAYFEYLLQLRAKKAFEIFR